MVSMVSAMVSPLAAEVVEGSADELQQKVDSAVAAAQSRERALVLSSRLAAMGTLAAGIAHEINNPIGGMANAVQRMKKSEALTDRGAVYLDLVQNGLDRVAGIVRRVLDFTPKSVQAEPFAIQDAWDAALALVAHRTKQAEVQVEVQVEAGLPPVYGDRHELQQVLLNLVINSLDAFADMDPSLRPERMSVTFTAKAGPKDVVVEVADNGPGMAHEDVPRVFDPFFSAKKRPDASGLGMFISYTIVQNHGGTMEVDSMPGQGFRTVLRLPREPTA